MRVLTGPAVLLREFVLAGGLLADRLLVSDVRPAGRDLDAVLAAKTIDEDRQMELAHPGDPGLPGLDVGEDAERGILEREAREGPREPLLIRGRARLDREFDHRLGDGEARERERPARIGERVPGAREPEPDHRGDLARAGAVRVHGSSAVHEDEPAHALGLARPSIVDERARPHAPGVDPEQRDRADAIEAHHLEGERRERPSSSALMLTSCEVAISTARSGATSSGDGRYAQTASRAAERPCSCGPIRTAPRRCAASTRPRGGRARARPR